MKKTYQTRQRKEILSFLQKEPDKQYTIDEIAEHLDGVGKSSAYRIMSNLAEEGLVRRFVKNPGRRYLYQLLFSTECNSHFHLKCSNCGKIIHLEHGFSSDMRAKIAKQHGFLVDESQTVLIGRCGECRKDGQ